MRAAIDSPNGWHCADSIRAIDCVTKVEYVLVRADLYERLKALLSDDLPDVAPVMNEVMAEDDAKDPYLESYQHYAREAP